MFRQSLQNTSSDSFGRRAQTIHHQVMGMRHVEGVVSLLLRQLKQLLCLDVV